MRDSRLGSRRSLASGGWKPGAADTRFIFQPELDLPKRPEYRNVSASRKCSSCLRHQTGWREKALPDLAQPSQRLHPGAGFSRPHDSGCSPCCFACSPAGRRPNRRRGRHGMPRATGCARTGCRKIPSPPCCKPATATSGWPLTTDWRALTACGSRSLTATATRNFTTAGSPACSRRRMAPCGSAMKTARSPVIGPAGSPPWTIMRPGPGEKFTGWGWMPRGTSGC